MKKILITGVSRGIGLAVAKRFLADEQWSVIGTSTSSNCPISNVRLNCYKLDLSNPESITQFVDTLKELGEKFDCLLNNAAVYLDHNNNSLVTAMLRKTLEINLIGTSDLTGMLLSNNLLSSTCRIINISSGAGSFSGNLVGSFAPSYKISKAAINMYTKILDLQLKESNQDMSVASLDPGWVRTDMGGEDADRDAQEPAEEIYELANREVLESGLFWHKGEPRAW